MVVSDNARPPSGCVRCLSKRLALRGRLRHPWSGCELSPDARSTDGAILARPRHEGACRLADGVDIRSIQLILGHSDVKTTERCVNVSDQELLTTDARGFLSRLCVKSGAPDRIRTCGLRLRRPTLYPAELRAREVQ